VLAFFLVGCQDRTSNRVEPAGAKGVAKGDYLVVPISSDPPSLDFLTCTDVWCNLVARFVADSLVDEGENLETVPRLASSWEFSEGGKSLVFHLRPGVRWHDGVPFTSRDVVFTYQRIVDPSSGAAHADQFAEVEKVWAPDELTVQIRYRQPSVLALDAWKTPMLPEHLPASVKGAPRPTGGGPMGTGPFRFVRSERGGEIILESNDDYFLGRPHLNGIVFRVIPSSATQFQALLTGETDWSPIPPLEWGERGRDPRFRERFRVFEYPALFLYYIGWNEKTPFFSDPRIRRAMTLLLDREGFLRTVLAGAGVPAASTFHPGQFGYDAALTPLPYDPILAGRLLDEAGWKRDASDGLRRRQGREFRFALLIFQGDPLPQQIASLLADSLQRTGVTVDIRLLDFPALLDRLHRHDFEAVLSGWALTSNPDPTWMLHSNPHLGPSNYVGYGNPEMDRLLESSRAEMDAGRRAEIYRQVQDLEAQDQPYSFLFFPLTRVALDSRFQDVRPSPVTSPLKPYPGPLLWYVPASLQKYLHPP
jgi:peptide/nickel transport system substrate-binding protein